MSNNTRNDYDFDEIRDIAPTHETIRKTWSHDEEVMKGPKPTIRKSDRFSDDGFPQFKSDPPGDDDFPPYKPHVNVDPVQLHLDEVGKKLASDEDLHIIEMLQEARPELFGTLKNIPTSYKGIKPEAMIASSDSFDKNEAWIQTYSGKRFNPTKPRVDAICLQDIAHSLSMQCRFSGHSKKFYSVAQHSVLVSYVCDFEDALWGLMHDASEAYLIDVPRPLKRSGKFNDYLSYEHLVQSAICQRFKLDGIEPESVKKADKILLATEARDLMSPLRNDWEQMEQPLPFKIDALPPREAKRLFIQRFFQLIGKPGEENNYYLYDIDNI